MTNRWTRHAYIHHILNWDDHPSTNSVATGMIPWSWTAVDWHSQPRTAMNDGDWTQVQPSSYSQLYNCKLYWPTTWTNKQRVQPLIIKQNQLDGHSPLLTVTIGMTSHLHHWNIEFGERVRWYTVTNSSTYDIAALSSWYKPTHVGKTPVKPHYWSWWKPIHHHSEPPYTSNNHDWIIKNQHS